MAYMVKGLISQFVAHVTIRPFGFFETFMILLKSIFNIIGKIINQIKIAVGIETL